MNQKAVWFIAMVVGRREPSVSSEQTLAALQFNEVKNKGELIDCRHMRELCRPSRKFFWNVAAHEVARSAHGSTVIYGRGLSPAEGSPCFCLRDPVSGHW